MNVQTLFLHPLLGRGGTDYLYYRKLKELERSFPVLLRPLDAPGAVALGNVLHAADALWGRYARRQRVAMPAWWSSLRRWTFVPRAKIGSQTDLVFTNFLIPVNRVSVPIVMEADFFVYGPPDERRVVEQWLHVPAWFIRRATYIVVRHELSRAVFAAKYREDSDKAVVVPFYLPWVEPVPEEAVFRKFSGSGRSEMRVLFVGNDAWRKGLPNLLEAYSLLRRAGRRFRLTIISEFRDGPVALPADAVVGMNLTPHDVYRLMAEAHILAMPTRQDAFGLVFLEAMANGCALLIPDTSPHRELLGTYGLSAPPDDVGAIAAALDELLDNREYALSSALRGRQAFVKSYHHSVVGKQYWDLFQRAVESPHTS